MKPAQVVLAFSLVVSCGIVASAGAATASNDLAAVDPAKAGWTPAALDEIAAYVQSQKTTGFLIV
jgi:hypothetical protein